MNKNTARFLLGIGLPVASVAVAAGSWLAWRDKLPAKVATNFDGSGAADSASSHAAFVASFGIPMVIGALVCLGVAARGARLRRMVAAAAAFCGGTLATLLSAIVVTTLWTQRGLSDWTQARLPVGVMLAVVVIGLAGGVVASWLASALTDAEPLPRVGGSDAPIMELDTNEQAVWVSSQTFTPFAVIAALVLVFCLVARVVVLDSWLAIAMPCFVSLLVLAFASYRLRVDAAGLHVRSAILPWPRMHLPVDEIQAASIIDVRPMEWGGWGYRGSLKLMKQAAIVQGAGPGMRVDLSGGRVFVVTTDNPETPVALMNALVQRQASTV